MGEINLHTIFRHIINDNNFLSTVIETDNREIEHKKNRHDGFNLMANMIIEYIPLTPYESQTYGLFPSKIKSFISPNYIRLGIKNVIEKNLNIINISFLNSLNILLRPYLYKLNIDDHIKNLILLENFISHKIQRNYQIDKIKNTKKVQNINKSLIKDLVEGKISHDLIQYIINIFEINLLVFDLTKSDVYLYWTRGYKYPYFNIFKNLYCMAYVQGNYEPIIPEDYTFIPERIHKMYIHILTCKSEIIYPKGEIELTVSSLLVLDSWNIPDDSYIKIIESFFNKPVKTMDDYYKDVAAI